FDINSSFIAPNNIVRTHKDWFLTYGTKKYFNPGLPEVMQYVTNVVKDIVTRYDIDAIHMDDYFYPYRIPGKEFPDASAYHRYGAGMKKDDWRRSNCDSIIKMIHNMILDTKPLIKFGISPFGVWRNKDQDADGSNTHAGQTNYDDLYADILLWLDKGWIDYVAPQLYWEIGHGLCDYETLLAWWSSHSYGKHIYIGHGIYKAVDKPIPAWRNTNEIPNELKMLRADPNIQGSIYYSGMSLFHNPNGWGDSLKNNYYKTPALIPPMQWVDINAPHAPVITNFTEARKNINNDFIFYAKAGDSLETEEVKTYVVYISGNKDSLGLTPFMLIAAQGKKEFQFNISQQQIPTDWEACYITNTSVDRENNESGLSNVVQLIKTKKGWAIPK
ncbi:MAG: family 10 glycosylhydrolase, partial [Panacibacter sp.]